jgi:hypothetical protein
MWCMSHHSLQRQFRTRRGCLLVPRTQFDGISTTTRRWVWKFTTFPLWYFTFYHVLIISFAVRCDCGPFTYYRGLGGKAGPDVTPGDRGDVPRDGVPSPVGSLPRWTTAATRIYHCFQGTPSRPPAPPRLVVPTRHRHPRHGHPTRQLYTRRALSLFAARGFGCIGCWRWRPSTPRWTHSVLLVFTLWTC